MTLPSQAILYQAKKIAKPVFKNVQNACNMLSVVVMWIYCIGVGLQKGTFPVAEIMGFFSVTLL